jgi:hypothetical protein
MENRIKEVFTDFEINDFEKVMKLISDSSRIVEKLDKGLADKLLDDVEKLKAELVRIISENHPQNTNSVTAENYATNKLFLKRFDSLFTVNYDLLMYWSVLRNDLWTKFQDGFRGGSVLSWGNKDAIKDQNWFWLHGGLHLFLQEAYLFEDNFTLSTQKITKVKIRKDDITNIKVQIQDRLQDDVFPFTITEGSSRSKVQSIIKNEYLKYGLRRFRDDTNHLVTFGMSFEQDAHLLVAIHFSDPKKKLFFGIHEPNDAKKRALEAKIVKHVGDRPVAFWDTSSVKIW